jgi:hypothetical protein
LLKQAKLDRDDYFGQLITVGEDLVGAVTEGNGMSEQALHHAHSPMSSASGKYSAEGLKKLSPQLQNLEDLPLSAQGAKEWKPENAPLKCSIQGVQAKLSAKLNIKEGRFEIVDRDDISSSRLMSFTNSFPKMKISRCGWRPT